MKDIEKVEAYLRDVPVVYLTTVENGKPKCRPIGLHLLVDGVLYFGIGTGKDVYRQMQANPFVEFCVCKDREFLRYYGRAVFETDERIADMAKAAVPFLQTMYNESTGRKLGMFHLEDAVAEFRTMKGVRESLSL